jgi:pimeloyl-ACP methyl ester carboxylesterase
VPTPDGVRVAVHDLGGQGPPLVAAHAAGFHGLVFGPLARLLADSFRCVAFDARGHGDSRLPAGVTLDWYGLAADVLAVVDGLALERPYGLGHSSGGTALLMAEEARPGTFAALYCYEPVLVPADPPLGRDHGNWLAARARRRRDAFESRDDAYCHYAAKPPLNVLDPEVLRAYVDHGFADVEGDGVALKCRPDDEAAVYETATANDAYPRLGDVHCPVLIACGSESDGCTPERARAHAGHLPAGRAETLPGLGHFGPLARPEHVAASVRAFLSASAASVAARRRERA